MKNNIGARELKELKLVSKNYDKDLEKINKGTPIQHLIGYVNFYGYKILVNKNVLIPRPETEYLVEKTINYIRKYNFENPNILDLCTGSGCIGIALYKEVKSSVTISDLSSKALKTAKKNIIINNSDITIIKSDLFKKINSKYDIIISNPPYISKTEVLSKEVLKEPHKALYSNNDGTYHILKIIKESQLYLKNKSLIALEINSYSKNKIEKEIKKYYNNYKFEKDLTGKLRYLFIFNNCE